MNLKTWCESGHGRQTALSKHLRVSPSAVSQAINNEIRIPPSWYREIVDFTGGEVSLEDLVPHPTEAA